MKPSTTQLCSAAGAALFSYLVFGQVFALSVAFACCAAASVTTRSWAPIRTAVAALVFLVACYLIVTATSEVSGIGPIGPGFMEISRTVASFFLTVAAGNAIAVVLVIYSSIYAQINHYDGYPTRPKHNGG
ncbi:hypothetical protein [Pseudomonas chlororaphis]|uniref:hypothetical protein n=1 Tax=Pseudomonas chlororaphis TaxID=587753 RepID=UPI0024079789|nr:hypothetical protein [Pseudomonas chlororaphis]